MGNKLKLAVVFALLALFWIWFDDGFDPKTLAGKRVLITGASSGIGEHLAYEYSKLGARVMIAARRADLLKDVAKKCLDFGAQHVDTVVADMTKVEDRDRVVAEAQSRLGGLDVLLLNHGMVKVGLWLGVESSHIVNQHFQVNFLSHVDLAAKALPMLTESRGSIGIVSSAAGKIPVPVAASYSSTKFALQGFFHAVRQEFLLRNLGISVTLGVIGPVETDLVARNPKDKRMFLDAFGLFVNIFWQTPDNTAVAIIRGVATRQVEVCYGKMTNVLVAVYTVSDWFFPWLKDYCLQLVGTTAINLPELS